MSYSAEIKEKICSLQIKNNCCKKAFLHGVMSVRGYTRGEDVSVNLYGKTSVSYVCGIVSEYYQNTPSVSHLTECGAADTLTFFSPDAYHFADDMESGDTSHLFEEKCSQCRMNFLRGLFLACGRVIDPSKQYQLEFSVGDRADIAEAFLWDCDLHPRRVDRRREKLLCFKDSTSIEEFFVLLGINQYAYSVMNEKIKRDLINQANRVTNCETVNIAKAVKTASAQASLIKRLIDEGLISSLPPELAETALLRYENSDLSLSALAARMPGSITKSGLKHRLDKLCELAREMLKEKK